MHRRTTYLQTEGRKLKYCHWKTGIQNNDYLHDETWCTADTEVSLSNLFYNLICFKIQSSRISKFNLLLEVLRKRHA